MVLLWYRAYKVGNYLFKKESALGWGTVNRAHSWHAQGSSVIPNTARKQNKIKTQEITPYFVRKSEQTSLQLFPPQVSST